MFAGLSDGVAITLVGEVFESLRKQRDAALFEYFDNAFGQLAIEQGSREDGAIREHGDDGTPLPKGELPKLDADGLIDNFCVNLSLGKAEIKDEFGLCQGQTFFQFGGDGGTKPGDTFNPLSGAP